MKRTSLLFYCLCILAIVTSCSRSETNVNEKTNVITENRKVSEFEQILYNGNGNLFISQGEEESVRIEGDKDVISMITTIVIDKALHIDYKKGIPANQEFITKPVNIYVQVKSIEELRLAGTGNIIGTTPLQTHALKLSISGSGNASIDVNGHKLVTILSGSGKFEIKGKTENQDIWISGSGIYQGLELVSNIANVNITGSGAVYVNVQDEMEVHISGAGVVIYKGKPRIHQTIAGSGNIVPYENG